ncbi:phage tail protein [Rodentibacter pneumotropicus]|uniref:phage tail-collar fiber domain-containing protein n=1 Tax=Rodentibacter pneumotropicus TaxID=758 RepID=UPI001863B098|nr:phage tail protein [Rodentibacter pneumotropicus]
MASLITPQFERYIAEQTIAGGTVQFDEFIFANVPGLNENNLAQHLTMPTAAQIVHRQAVSQSGVINENSVVYSVTIGTEVGDFDFNFIGLINKSKNMLAVAVQTEPVKKIRNKNTVQGNSITRNILLEFTGAKALTGVNVNAKTWQIDFTVRLHGLDEKIRLTNRDLYGRAVFFDEGFLVRHKTGNQFTIQPGIAYAEGVRMDLGAVHNITANNLPCSIYADVVHHCTVTGAYETEIKYLTTPRDDYVDTANRQHYVQILADIDRQGNVTDRRLLSPFLGINPLELSDTTENTKEQRGHAHKLPIASTAKRGIVKLFSGFDSDSEDMAFTAKGAKGLKALIDALRSYVTTSFILNSKKSNAVNSASSDTVATSLAAKTAYDKAVSADNNANRRAFGLALSNEDLNSIAVTGIYRQSLNSNSTSARHYPIEQAGKLIVTGSSGFGAQQLYISYHDNHIYARGKNQNGWSDWKRIDGLNGVSKSGDTMTGNLVIDTDDSLLKGKRSGVNKYAVGLRNSTSNDVVVLNYTDNTSIELLANSVYSNKTLVAPGMILEDSDWTGLNIKNLSGRYVRFEGNPHSATNMLTIMYREANGTNINTVSLRKKGGTLALLEDFTYQKIGNFEVRRYPDGTMIQTYFAEFNDIFGANSGLGGYGQKQLTWAAAFVGKPIVFGNITTSLEENHNAGVNILTKSTNTTLYWYNYESGSANQRLCRLQFLAIGRWR